MQVIHRSLEEKNILFGVRDSRVQEWPPVPRSSRDNDHCASRLTLRIAVQALCLLGIPALGLARFVNPSVSPVEYRKEHSNSSKRTANPAAITIEETAEYCYSHAKQGEGRDSVDLPSIQNQNNQYRHECGN